MAHTFDVSRAHVLEDVSRYRFLSREELLAAIGTDPGVVLDLGSGTGFYTDDVAPRATRTCGVDVQAGMHARYREKGLPDGVRLITADVNALPVRSGAVDVAFSTMTFHEFAEPPAIAEVARVLRPGGRFVSVDWSAAGEGASGPPLGERRDADSGAAMLESAGFAVERAEERPETFVLAATLD